MEGFLIVMGILLVHCFSQVTATTEEETNKQLEAIDVCKKKHGITKIEMNQIFEKGQVIDSESAKCFLACFMTSMGTMRKDGKIDWNEVDKANKVHFIDISDLTKAFAVSSICNEKVTENLENNCETAFNTVKCFFEEAKKLGLQLIKTQSS